MRFSQIDWNRVFFKTYYEKRSFGHLLVNFNRIWVIHVAMYWFYTAYNSPTIYNGFNSTIDSFRGEHDVYGSMAAGALTGALYKSTGAPSRSFLRDRPSLLSCHVLAGVKPALAAATFISGLAGIWSYVKTRV